jgi:oxygen-dependent protoporphyrinogen oxidase
VQLSPLLEQLIDELQLRDDLMIADERAKKRFIVRGGALVAVPASLGGFLSTNLLSTSAKLRLFREPFVARYTGDRSESVASFVERRLGREVLDYAFNPFLSGVYAGRPELLAIEHSFPFLFELERDHGSIIRGAVARRKAARRERPNAAPKFVRSLISFRDGMAMLPSTIGSRWSDRVRFASRVRTLERRGDRWFVDTGGESFMAQRVVCASSADATADLVASFDAELARSLRAIPYAPIASVVTVYRREDVGHPLDGFGCLVPEVERRQILGIIFSSSLFGNRAPENHVAVTTFVGGARQPELVDCSDEALSSIVDAEHRALIGTTAPATSVDITRWSRAIPQYGLDHSSVVASLDAAEGRHSGLYLVGNYRGGVSVGDCVRSARALADRLGSSGLHDTAPVSSKHE